MTSSADISHGPEPAVATPRAVARTRALTTAEIAWLAAVPTALVMLLAIAVLGPELGRTLFPPSDTAIWPSNAAIFRPEPAEQGRFLVSLAAPILLAALTVAGVRRTPRLAPQTIAVLVTIVQATGVAVVVAAVFAQRELVYGQVYTGDPITSLRRTYFTPATYLVAALLTAAVVASLRSDTARERLVAWTRETTVRRIIATLAAVVLTVVWLLHAYNTEDTIAAGNPDVAFHLMFPLDETFSVLDGRAPLVDFVPLYGFLWPYPFAAAMAVFGETIGVYLALAVGLTGAAMLAIYAVLRRAARSSVAGLLLFAPFLATSFFLVQGSLDSRFTFAALPGTFPMRYAGPFLLAWLLARHLDGARPRQAWLLFLAAGMVAMNNVDAGIPALGATLAALLWTAGRPTAASLGRLALALVAGLAAAFALVSAVTLVHAGSLPDLGLLLRFPRVFAAAGFFLLPMPAFGLHIVLYLTFVAAIGVATVRAVTSRSAHDRLLTGMLAFSGVFGLGTGAYFAGRSHPESLIAIFPPWALALALLTVVVVHDLARAPRRLPSLAALACLFGFGVAACSLAQTPAPWQELDRLSRPGAPLYATPSGQDFVARHIRPGEQVLITMQLGHRMGRTLGVTNVNPYTGAVAMPLPELFDDAVDALREAGGRKAFVWIEEANPEAMEGLRRDGFALRDEDATTGMQLWVDTTTR